MPQTDPQVPGGSSTGNGGGTSTMIAPLEKELTPMRGISISDFVRINADGNLTNVLAYVSMAYTSAGTLTFDLKRNSVSLLNSTIDLLSLSALPSTVSGSLILSPTPITTGDVLELVTTSDNDDLDGSGLTVVLQTEVS